MKFATFYAFSTENQHRPPEEVAGLLKLFDEYLDDIKSLMHKNYRIKFLGDLSYFSDELQYKMRDAEETSKDNDRLTCLLAVNYGGRAEIVNAALQLIQDGVAPGDLTEEVFARRLYTGDFPDFDLLIRPGGEKRLSNFLLWQSAYAEFVFMDDLLFPDFNREHLLNAVRAFSARERRFGKVGELTGQ